MVLKFTLGKDKDKTIKNDRLAIFFIRKFVGKIKSSTFASFSWY